MWRLGHRILRAMAAMKAMKAAAKTMKARKEIKAAKAMKAPKSKKQQKKYDEAMACGAEVKREWRKIRRENLAARETHRNNLLLERMRAENAASTRVPWPVATMATVDAERFARMQRF